MREPIEDSITVSENMGEYKCLYCERTVVPKKGYDIRMPNLQMLVAKFCSNQDCNLLSLWTPAIQIHDILVLWYRKQRDCGIQMLIQSDYREACKSFVNDCYLAVALVCRTMLAHIAINTGGNPNDPFEEHIDHLVNTKNIPVTSQEPLKEVLGLANKATHNPTEITEMDALKCLANLGMVLRYIFGSGYFYIESDIAVVFDFMLIAEALRKMCKVENIEERLAFNFQDDDPILQKLRAKMSENKKCVETRQKLTNALDKLGMQGIGEMWKRNPSLVACVEYLASSPELQKLADKLNSI